MEISTSGQEGLATQPGKKDTQEIGPGLESQDDAWDGFGPQHDQHQKSQKVIIENKGSQSLSAKEEAHDPSYDGQQKDFVSQATRNTSLVEACQKSLPRSGASSVVSFEVDKNETLPLGLSLEKLILQSESTIPPEGKAPHEKGINHEKVNNESGEPAIKSSKKKKKKLPKPMFRERPRPPPPDIDFETEAYRANINQLAEIFSHFGNVAAAITRHEWSSRIVVYDRIESPISTTNERVEPWKDCFSAPRYLEFYDTLRNIPNDCTQRLILVEDLSPSLIDLLGATFQIPPHVFEEHLEGSGYRTIPEASNATPAWHARSSAQEFSSITWYRPVLSLIPMRPRFRARLVADRRPAVPCFYDGCDQNHNVRLETSGNIWRRNLDLCPEPGVYHKGSETEYPVGWEERATIWNRDIDGCKFIILLLDPLPTITVANENAGAARRPTQQRLPPMLVSLMPRPGTQRAKTRKLPRQDLYPRQNIDDWMDHSNNHTAFVPPPPPPPPPFNAMPLPENNATRVVLELPSPLPPPPPPLNTSRATHVMPFRQSLATGANLKTPEPDFSPAALRRRATKPDLDPGSDTSDRGDTQAPKMPGRKSSLGEQANLPSNMQPRLPSTSRPPSPHFVVVDQGSVVTEIHGPFIPYHPIKARSASSANVGARFTKEHIRKYIKSLQIPSSTLDEFDHFLKLQYKGKEAVHDPFRALFRVIHDDTNSLLEVIRTTLQRIREGTMDEDLIQKRVTFWRGLLHRLNFNLAEVDQRLRAFTHFTHDYETEFVAFDRRTELPSKKLANDTQQTLRSCMELLDRSSSSLLAEMQIVDSRRSIAEAESISKLTELAFVFIPLSFVASLFSMQVHEIEGGVPLYVFVVVAIGFVLTAYAVRLSIRSSRLIDYRSKVIDQIRRESHIHYNQTIPAHTFFLWVTRATSGRVLKSMKSFIVVFAPLLFVLAIVAAILSPIILLWLRGISRGFSVVITVLLLLLDVVLVWPVMLTASGKLQINPKEIVREIQRNHERNRKRRERAKKRRKEKAGIDPEAIDMNDSDSSNESDGGNKKRVSLSSIVEI